MAEPVLHPDFSDLLEELDRAHAEFLIVGAFAVAVHGAPRATGDLDVWIRPTPDNAERVARALAAFGAPMGAPGIRVQGLHTEGQVVQLGVPPRRIDLTTAIDGVTFDEAWSSRQRFVVAGREVAFPSREVLIRNKRASGRPKDLADLVLLGADRG